MSKRTPGPWSLKVHDGDGKTVTANSDWSIHGPEGQVIAMEGYSNPNADGDAHLLAAAQQMYEALKAAKQFIANGVALGYIRMPDAGAPDPAHDTPRIIDAALKAASGEQS